MNWLIKIWVLNLCLWTGWFSSKESLFSCSLTGPWYSPSVHPLYVTRYLAPFLLSKAFFFFLKLAVSPKEKHWEVSVWIWIIFPAWHVRDIPSLSSYRKNWEKTVVNQVFRTVWNLSFQLIYITWTLIWKPVDTAYTQRPMASLNIPFLQQNQ